MCKGVMMCMCHSDGKGKYCDAAVKEKEHGKPHVLKKNYSIADGRTFAINAASYFIAAFLLLQM